jgi:hypothetical protein
LQLLPGTQETTNSMRRTMMTEMRRTMMTERTICNDDTNPMNTRRKHRIRIARVFARASALIALGTLPSSTLAQSTAPSSSSAPPIAWAWNGPNPGFGRFPAHQRVDDGRGGFCTFVYSESASTTTLSCSNSTQSVRWTMTEGRAFVEDAALLVHCRRLYAVRFSDIATGARVTAFDLATGRQVWSRALQCIGPVGHSEYLNAVRVRWDRDAIVVFGWESAGRYIEVVDPETGRTVSNTRLAP